MNELQIFIGYGPTKKERKIQLLNLLKKKYSISNIDHNLNGKPCIPTGSISFSHTKNTSVCIYSKNLKVSIDIEFMKGKINKKYILKALLNQKEIKEFENLQESNLFYKFWTRTESLVKLVSSKGIFELKKYAFYPFRDKYYDLNCQQKSFVVGKNIMCTLTWSPICNPGIIINTIN